MRPRTQAVAGALFVAGLVVAIGVWFVLGGPPRRSLGPAAWFVLDATDPLAPRVAVARPDGDLALLDLDGAALAPVLAGSADCNVVFLSGRSMLLVNGRDAAPERVAVALVGDGGERVPVECPPLAPGARLVPVVQGTRASGVAPDGGNVVLARLEGTRIVGLSRFSLASRRIDELPYPAPVRAPELVSAGPHGRMLAVVQPTAERTDRRELVLIDLAAGSAERVAEVEPVAPWWLPDAGVVLFERSGGGISRYVAGTGKPVWVCDGTYPRECARGHWARRDFSDPFVFVEKRDLLGYVQLTRVFPFESGATRESGITTGRIDHYGLSLSRDHRYIAYRQTELSRSGESADERLVVLDQRPPFRSTTVASRRMPPRTEHVGPTFAPLADVLLLVADGELWRIDLEKR